MRAVGVCHTAQCCLQQSSCGGARSCSVSRAYGFGCGIGAGLCFGNAMEVCIAMASVIAPFSLRWWRFEAFPPHLKPLPFCSRLLRWSCYHSREIQLLARFFFFIYQPPCSRIHRSVSCTSFACAGLLHVASILHNIASASPTRAPIGFGPCLSDTPPACSACLA